MQKLIVMILCLMFFVSAGNAANIRYKGNGPWEQLSIDGSNGWQSSVVPGSGDTARGNWGGNTVTLNYAAPDIWAFELGVDESGTFEINNGGILTSLGNSKVGNNAGGGGLNPTTGELIINTGGAVNVNGDWLAVAGSFGELTGIVDINGGTLNVAGHLWCATGTDSTAIIDIDGGSLNVGGMIGMGTINPGDMTNNGGIATINVNNGGSLNLTNIHGGIAADPVTGSSIREGSIININGSAQVTLPGNFTGVIQAYADAGRFSGNGIMGNIAINVANDITTVTALAAGEQIWTPTIAFLDEYLWTEPNNWSLGDKPFEPVLHRINGEIPCILDAPVIVSGLHVGYRGHAGTLIIKDGGNLEKVDGGWTGMDGQPGVVEIQQGGALSVGGHWWNGLYDTSAGATLIMDGGSLTAADAIDLGRGSSTAACYVDLFRGIVEARYIPGDSKWVSGENGSVMDIRFGTFVLGGDRLSAISSLISNGGLTAFGGESTLLYDYDITNSNKTTVSAIDPMNAWPAMGETVQVNSTLNLTWVNYRDPGTQGIDPVVNVWFGTDPNKATGNYSQVVTAGNNTTTVQVDASAVGTYYWQVDYVDAGIADSNGIVYTFNTTNDTPPSISIDTNNTLTWAGEPVLISATINDDGTSPVEIVWSSSADPNVVFDPVTTTLPIGTVYPVSVTTIATGDSHQPFTTVTVTVSDDYNPQADLDSMILDIAQDACHAAGGGNLHLWDVYTADLNRNCIVDLEDLAILAADWLETYALTEPVEIP